MKKIFAIILVGFVSSCASLNAPSGSGIFKTEVKEMTYYDPYIKPNRKTTLCAKNILGLVSSGDIGFDNMKMRSGIRKIAVIEKTYNGNMFYGQSCIVVTGE